MQERRERKSRERRETPTLKIKRGGTRGREREKSQEREKRERFERRGRGEKGTRENTKEETKDVYERGFCHIVECIGPGTNGIKRDEDTRDSLELEKIYCTNGRFCVTARADFLQAPFRFLQAHE